MLNGGYDYFEGTGEESIFSLSGGTLNLGGLGSGFDYSQTYQLFRNFSSGSVSNLNIIGYDLDNAHGLAQLSDTGVLYFGAIPEPSTYALIVGFAATGLMLVRRRISRRS